MSGQFFMLLVVVGVVLTVSVVGLLLAGRRNRRTGRAVRRSRRGAREDLQRRSVAPAGRSR